MPNSICAAWFFFLSFYGAADLAQQSRHIENAAQLHVGMTPAEVQEVMGSPTGRYEAKSLTALVFSRFLPKHWFYGTTCDIHSIVVPGLPFPNPIPVHLRLFSYADDDVVVRWSFDDQVAEITRPKPIRVPLEFYGIHNARIFVSDIVTLISSVAK